VRERIVEIDDLLLHRHSCSSWQAASPSRTRTLPRTAGQAHTGTVAQLVRDPARASPAIGRHLSPALPCEQSILAKSPCRTRAIRYESIDAHDFP
jgi:hypothetical protein